MYLSPLQPQDLPVIQKWLSDEPLFRAVVVERPCLERPVYTLIIRLNDGTPVGWIDFFNVDWANRKAEAGIAIPERRGRGLSYRAGRRALMFAFQVLRLNRVVLRIPEKNTASIRLAEKLGFTREGVEREAVVRDGEPEDIIVYAMLKREFEGT